MAAEAVAAQLAGKTSLLKPATLYSKRLWHNVMLEALQLFCLNVLLIKSEMRQDSEAAAGNQSGRRIERGLYG